MMDDGLEGYLNRILRILVEEYGQTAQNTAILSRDSDLRAGSARLANLISKTQHDRELPASLAIEALIATAISFAIYGFGKWLGEWGTPVGLVTAACFLGVWIIRISRKQRRLTRDSDCLQHLASATENLQGEYVRHSALCLRIEESRQRRVTLEALLFANAGVDRGSHGIDLSRDVARKNL